MLSPILAALAIMAQPTPADDVIWLYHLDPNLEIARRAWWRVKGEIGVLYFTPGEELVGFVTAGKQLQLVRWTTEGKELSRRPIDATGRIASRWNADGTLTVVAEDALVKLAADGRMLLRRELKTRLGERYWVRASPGGAWFALDDRLVFEGFDGRETIRKAPLGVEERDCGERKSKHGPCPAYLRVRDMLATERDECLLVEALEKSHEVSGGVVDVTRQAVLSLFRVDGQLVTRRTLGTTEMRLEWFWSEKSSNNPTPFPTSFGLVRRRYDGQTDVGNLEEKSSGGFMAVVDRLTRFDHDLRERWNAHAYQASAGVMSPPWTKGVLLFLPEVGSPSPSRIQSMRSYVCSAHDDQGGSERLTHGKVSENDQDPKPTGVAEEINEGEWSVSFCAAVGQTLSGGWMVAVY